jgi:hypothetical protein
MPAAALPHPCHCGPCRSHPVPEGTPWRPPPVGRRDHVPRWRLYRPIGSFRCTRAREYGAEHAPVAPLPGLSQRTGDVAVSNPPTNRLHQASWARRRRLATIASAAGLLTALLAPVPAAHADTATFDDVGGTGLGVDIVKVRVVNEGKVRVRTRHTDLRPTAEDSVAIFLDVNARRRGPEYRLSGLLSADRDWQLVTVRRWQARRLVDCRVTLRVNYRRDVTVGVFDRDCLGGYAGRIRVAVRAGHGQRAGDWAPRGPRQFTGWVPR